MDTDLRQQKKNWGNLFSTDGKYKGILFFFFFGGDQVYSTGMKAVQKLIQILLQGLSVENMIPMKRCTVQIPRAEEELYRANQRNLHYLSM